MDQRRFLDFSKVIWLFCLAVMSCSLVYMASANTHRVSITVQGLEPQSLSITVGDTLAWQNLTSSYTEIRCGTAFAGTAAPENAASIELNIHPFGSASKKIVAGGNYIYRLESDLGTFFGEVVAVAPLPVMLTDFVATTIKNEVILDWSTSGEINNERFEIQRVRVERITEGNSGLNFKTIGVLQGIGNTSNVHYYSYCDRNLESGRYLYRLKQFDYNGEFVYHVLSDEIVVGVPSKFRISQNFPNPFNPETKVIMEIPASGNLRVTLYNSSGKEIGRYYDGIVTEGYSSLVISGEKLESGMYFCMFEYSAGGNRVVETKKLVLLK